MPSFLLLNLITFIAISLSPSSVQGQDVLTALRNNNAGQFADRIQASTELTDLVAGSPTLFAPIDTPGQRLQKRSLLGDSFGACKTLSNVTASHKRQGTFPSIDFTTSSTLVPSNLGGRNQALVSGGGTTIYAGLGQFVTIVQSFIPFDGGFIHTVTGALGIPSLLSSTISLIPDLSIVAGLLNSSGSASAFDEVPSSTFFIPDNEAFSGLGDPSANISIIDNHAVEGTVSYLPDFQNGQVLTAVSGFTLKITIVNGDVYVNEALIVTPNLILENGVAHVINKVLGGSSANSTSTTSTTTTTNTTTSTTSTTSAKAPLFTGGAVSLTTGFIAVVISTVGSVLLPMLF